MTAAEGILYLREKVTAVAIIYSCTENITYGSSIMRLALLFLAGQR